MATVLQYTVRMYSNFHAQLTAGQKIAEEPIWELVRVVVMRDRGLRPSNSKVPVPTNENTYVGRIRFHRADGTPHWRPAHFELREDAANSPAHLVRPLFDPYLVDWVGAWQIFSGWEIDSLSGVTYETRQLWAISRALE